MPQVIEIKGGKVETIFGERDFVYLIEQHMDYEAADFFRELVKELEWYREMYDDYLE